MNIFGFLKSKKAFMFVVGALTVLLTNIVLPMLNIPADVIAQISKGIAIQVATFICGQGVADVVSGGKTSASVAGSGIMDSKKVKATLIAIVGTFLTAVIGLPQIVADQVINMIAGLLGAYNVMQGVVDGITGKNKDLPVMEEKDLPARVDNPGAVK